MSYYDNVFLGAPEERETPVDILTARFLENATDPRSNEHLTLSERLSGEDVFWQEFILGNYSNCEELKTKLARAYVEYEYESGRMTLDDDD